MHRILSLIGLLALAVPGSAAASEGPPVALPPEIAAHVPADLRSYFVAFMISPEVPKEMSQDLFERHQAYIREQFAKGTFRLAGPLTDGGRIRGMTIVAAASAEEARRIMDGDPAVAEKVLAVELHPAILPNLSGLKVVYATPSAAGSGNERGNDPLVNPR